MILLSYHQIKAWFFFFFFFNSGVRPQALGGVLKTWEHVPWTTSPFAPEPEPSSKSGSAAVCQPSFPAQGQALHHKSLKSPRLQLSSPNSPSCLPLCPAQADQHEEKTVVSAQAGGGNPFFLCLFAPLEPSTGWVMPTHSGEGQSSLLSLTNHKPVSSGDTLSSAPRNKILPAVWPSLGPGKSTLKTNHPTNWKLPPP